jgi:uncharacterized membrane protein
MIYETYVIGLKEGLKIGIVWLVFHSYLVLNDRKTLIKPFYFGLFFVSLVSVISFFLPQGLIIKEHLSNVIAMSFAFFFILSAAALFYASGINLFGESQRIKGIFRMFKGNAITNAIVFLSTFLFFSPESIGTVFFLKKLAFMKGTELMTYTSAFIGLFIAVAIFFTIVKFYKPYWIGSFFDAPQLILFLAIVKLLGSGIKGIAELSLIPSVQRGFMKFIHDFIHQTFVLLMVPDHPLLKTTVWNFIGIFFGSNLASGASLIILLFFPFMFIYHSLFKPLPEPEVQTGAQKRKIMSLLLSNRRRKALPVIFFIGLILIAWFSQRGETVSQLYKPKPRPVVVDKGIVIIPLNDPTMDLMDGALHKFSLIHRGEEVRIIIIKKSDNTLSVCLDACEICPPEGYGQREDHIVCIYCNTPIPIDTLGKAGGCNPIPLTAVIDERFVKIELNEILKKWGFVKTGESKEAIK